MSSPRCPVFYYWNMYQLSPSTSPLTMSIRFACGSLGSPGIRMISPMMTTIISAPLLMTMSRTFSSKFFATP